MSGSNKKNEDYVVRMPDEKDDYPGRPNPLRNYSPHSPTAAASGSTLKSIENNPAVAIVAYCVASISMTIVNKYLVSGSNWNMSFLYLAIQSTVCVVTVQGLSIMRLIPALDPFMVSRAKTFFPVAALLVGMIYTGAMALQYLSVPVYTIFKNLTIIVIAYGEVLWFGGSVAPLMLASFGMMVLSSVVAAWSDIHAAIGGSAHPAVATDIVSALNIGYAWMGANVVCSAAFVLGMRKLIHALNFKDRDTMFYNNLMSIPILIVCSLLTEDWSAENLHRNFPPESRTSQFIGIIYSGIMAVCISYCSAWCVRVTSSTTYSMVGALNKLPIALSGLVFFDAPVTLGSVSAIVMGFIAGLIYAWAKVRKPKNNNLPLTNPVMSASAKSSKDAINA